MTRPYILFGAFCGLLKFSIVAGQAGAAADPLENWPQWRGPLSTGVAPGAQPPVEWSENKNVRWKTEVPGNGHSSPVVFGDRIYLTSAIPSGKKIKPRRSTAPGAHNNLPVTESQKFVVMAIDRKNGKILWQRTLHEELPHEGVHSTASFASNSPVTDGERLYAFFGSFGLYCLNLEGELVWKKNLGRMEPKHGHGEGSSPALHGDTLIVNWDHEGQSFVVAFDKKTGKQRWQAERQEVTSWATPIVVEHESKAGKAQVIVNGTNRLRAYDLETGKIIWECGGLSANIVASPVAAEGMLFAASSYEKQAMLAIRLDGAEGDITGTDNVVWTRSKATPYVPSLLLYRDSLYFLRHYQGILSRVDAKTGEERQGPFRLNGIGNVYASPVAAADRVYITDLSGATLVISHEDSPRVLAFNRLDDSFSASAAIVGKELFLRGNKFLYCIAEK